MSRMPYAHLSSGAAAASAAGAAAGAAASAAAAQLRVVVVLNEHSLVWLHSPVAAAEAQAHADGLPGADLPQVSACLGLPANSRFIVRRLAHLLVVSLAGGAPRTGAPPPNGAYFVARASGKMRERQAASPGTSAEAVGGSTPGGGLQDGGLQDGGLSNAGLPMGERHLNAEQAAVLRLLRQGLTDRQIASRLHRRRRWVCYRVSEIKRRLGVVQRAALVGKRNPDF